MQQKMAKCLNPCHTCGTHLKLWALGFSLSQHSPLGNEPMCTINLYLSVCLLFSLGYTGTCGYLSLVQNENQRVSHMETWCNNHLPCMSWGGGCRSFRYQSYMAAPLWTKQRWVWDEVLEVDRHLMADSPVYQVGSLKVTVQREATIASEISTW